MGERLILVSCPFPITGGGRRSLEVLKRLQNYLSEDIEIVFPSNFIKTANIVEISEIDNIISQLMNRGIGINDYSLKLLTRNRDNLRLRNLDISEFFRGTFSFAMYARETSAYLKGCLKSIEAKNVRCIYSHHEPVDSVLLSYLMAEKLKKNLIILLQLEPFRPLSSLLKFDFSLIKYALSVREIINMIPKISINNYTRQVYNKILSFEQFKCFFSVSLAPLIHSGLLSYHPNYKILKPACAFESELLKYRKNLKRKEDYVVFFARLVPEKGIFELPYLWKKIYKEFPNLKLIVCGASHPRFLKKFKDIVKKLEIHDKIILKGYLSEKELFEIVSKAKVFIYLTHSDSFSLVTLESLAVGTPVVAYDIPAITHTYGDLKGVEIAPEWNISAMAQKVIEVLKMGEEEYYQMMTDEGLINFLNLHSSWENVAKAEAEALDKSLTG